MRVAGRMPEPGGRRRGVRAGPESGGRRPGHRGLLVPDASRRPWGGRRGVSAVRDGARARRRRRLPSLPSRFRDRPAGAPARATGTRPVLRARSAHRRDGPPFSNRCTSASFISSSSAAISITSRTCTRFPAATDRSTSIVRFRVRVAYQLIADFLPAGGTPQLVQRSFVTAAYTGSLLRPAALTRDVTDKVIGPTRVKLTLPEPMAGREQLITFDLQDAVTGAAVSDLEPYLGATGHLLVASADLAVASHFHPVAEISGRAGPTVVFQVLFPSPGDYRMWVQFQRRGQVLTAPFTFAVQRTRLTPATVSPVRASRRSLATRSERRSRAARRA